MTREISGEEALVSHVIDASQAAESIAERIAQNEPIVLGKRTLETGNPSIGEVMHGTSDDQLNAPNPSVEDDTKTPGHPESPPEPKDDNAKLVPGMNVE